MLIERANVLTVPATRLVQELKRRETGLVVDVGANDGGYGTELYGAGYAGDMISFEPLPDARRELMITAASYAGWTLAPALALSDCPGTVDFHVAGNSASSSMLTMNDTHVGAAPESATKQTITVQTARLDDIAAGLGLDRPHFFKIDTQGAEAVVLAGAEETIQHAIGVQIELSLLPLYDGQTLWRDMDDRLTSLGFKLWDMIPGFRHRQTGQLMQFDGVYFRD